MSKKWIIAIVAAVVVVVAGFGVWYFVIRDDSPAAVSIDRASDALDDAADKGSGSSGSSASSSLDGTWTVDDTIGSFSDFTSSFAGVRVQ